MKRIGKTTISGLVALAIGTFAIGTSFAADTVETTLPPLDTATYIQENRDTAIQYIGANAFRNIESLRAIGYDNLLTKVDSMKEVCKVIPEENVDGFYSYTMHVRDYYDSVYEKEQIVGYDIYERNPENFPDLQKRRLSLNIMFLEIEKEFIHNYGEKWNSPYNVSSCSFLPVALGIQAAARVGGASIQDIFHYVLQRAKIEFDSD